MCIAAKQNKSKRNVSHLMAFSKFVLWWKFSSLTMRKYFTHAGGCLCYGNDSWEEWRAVTRKLWVDPESLSTKHLAGESMNKVKFSKWHFKCNKLASSVVLWVNNSRRSVVITPTLLSLSLTQVTGLRILLTIMTRTWHVWKWKNIQQNF